MCARREARGAVQIERTSNPRKPPCFDPSVVAIRPPVKSGRLPLAQARLSLSRVVSTMPHGLHQMATSAARGPAGPTARPIRAMSARHRAPKPRRATGCNTCCAPRNQTQGRARATPGVVASFVRAHLVSILHSIPTWKTALKRTTANRVRKASATLVSRRPERTPR